MKLKTRNLNRLIEELSGREIDFFLYLIKRQCSMGCVDGVYYRDVLEDLHMPRSTFYTILDSLQNKGFVRVDWHDNRNGFNVVVIDNTFLGMGDYKEGYVNVNLDFILSEEFISLNVNLKKFFLRLLGLQANKKGVRLTYDTLKRYKVHKLMSELEKIFDILVDDNIFMFTIKPDLLQWSIKSLNAKHLEYEQKLTAYCREYDIDYTPAELIDSVRTIINGVKRNRMALIHKALDSIRKIGRLQPKLITYLIYCKPQY